jgi:hypothetical protein
MANSILSPVSLGSYFDNTTGQAKQANLFFYSAGTLDPIIVWTDSGMSIPFPQPVITTGNARIPPVYVGEIPPPGYRVRAFDQFQVLIEDLDGLPGAAPDPASVAPPTPVDPNAIAKTGDVKMKWSNHNPEPGWVEMTRGGTIGNPLSNASILASDTAHDLFIHLWQQDAPGIAAILPVIPSKGASAEGDWQDGRQITLPDMRGRFPGGIDQLDSGASPPASLTKRLDAGLFDLLPNITDADKPFQPEDYMKPWMLGARGGESVHQLAVTEMAVHLHDWIDYKGHSHYVYDQGHIHAITDPGHNHSIGTYVNANPGDSNAVIGRFTGGSDGYSFNSGGTLFRQVALRVEEHGANLSIQSHVTNIQTLNTQYASPGTPGAGRSLQYIGEYSADLKPAAGWHQPTENNPRPADWATESERGDKPHNTLQPFVLFAFFMKL